MPNQDTSIKSNMDEYGLGSLIPEIERAQESIVKALKKYGGKGNVKITLEYIINNDDVVTVKAKVNPKMPERQLAPVPMHVTRNGKLSTSPDGQYTMGDIEEIVANNKPVENVGSQQADILDINKKQSNGS